MHLEMNDDIREQWVAALKSGKYEQGKGMLAYVGGDDQMKHCCLGVLCEMAAEAGVVDKVNRKSIKSEATVFGGNDITLPVSVMEWAGINSAEGLLNDSSTLLSGLNDEGQTFDAIADIIANKEDVDNSVSVG